MNVPDKLISNCTWDEICIYIYIKKSKSMPSIRDIAKELDLSKSSVNRLVKNISVLGFIGNKTGTVVGTETGTLLGTAVGTAKSLSNNSKVGGSGTVVGTETGTLLGTAVGTKKNTIFQRKSDFEHSLATYVTSGLYKPEIVREFSDYWTEFNKSQTKMRWELEKTWETSKRLERWAERNKCKSKSSNLPVGMKLQNSKEIDYGKGLERFNRE